MIVEEYVAPGQIQVTAARTKAAPLAVVGMGAVLGQAGDLSEVSTKLFAGAPYGSRTQTITLPMKGLKFPPNDLKQSLGQQLMMLQATHEALDDAGSVNPEDTCVLIGMGCDPEVARYGARWRLKRLGQPLGYE